MKLNWISKPFVEIAILAALNATIVVTFLEKLLHIKFLSSTVYIIDFLPSRLDWHDVINISGLSLLLSLLATIYPAWRGARVQPAEALRYE